MELADFLCRVLGLVTAQADVFQVEASLSHDPRVREVLEGFGGHFAAQAQQLRRALEHAGHGPAAVDRCLSPLAAAADGAVENAAAGAAQSSGLPMGRRQALALAIQQMDEIRALLRKRLAGTLEPPERALLEHLLREEEAAYHVLRGLEDADGTKPV